MTSKVSLAGKNVSLDISATILGRWQMAYQISISATSVLGWSCRAGKWMENKAPRRLSATMEPGRTDRGVAQNFWGPQKGWGSRNESQIHANSLGWQPTSRHWLVVSHILRFQSLRIGFCRWILCRPGSFDPRIGFIDQCSCAAFGVRWAWHVTYWVWCRHKYVIVRYISRERCRLWIWGEWTQKHAISHAFIFVSATSGSLWQLPDNKWCRTCKRIRIHIYIHCIFDIIQYNITL
jgi:hypothetical protein